MQLTVESICLNENAGVPAEILFALQSVWNTMAEKDWYTRLTFSGLQQPVDIC